MAVSNSQGLLNLTQEPFEVRDLGLLDYESAYQAQKSWVEEKKKNPTQRDRLFLVEHPEVYTYGRKSQRSGTPFETIPGIRFIPVERGGEITLHNEGQLVAYPVLTLREDERDVHRHLRRLESTLIDVLKDFEVAGERREGATGVWVCGKQKKIASIGIAVTQWITFHGVALNVCNDLTAFHRIHPCGFSPEVMTSLQQELGSESPGLDEVKRSFVKHFAVHFDRFVSKSL